MITAQLCRIGDGARVVIQTIAAQPAALAVLVEILEEVPRRPASDVQRFNCPAPIGSRRFQLPEQIDEVRFPISNSLWRFLPMKIFIPLFQARIVRNVPEVNLLQHLEITGVSVRLGQPESLYS